MNKILILILIGTYSLFSQNTYMIPDAGGPGMEVQVEFVAPHNQNNFFGKDDFYINNPGVGNVSITVRGPLSNKLEVSPFVISWDGRLVSAYIFIDDDINPNSEDYSALSNNFKSEIVIEVGGTEVSSYDFHVIQPSSVGALLSGNLLGKVGTSNGLGYVSPRNTIVVDSLTLANNPYDVNRIDPDPATPGNQSFLPFIILSKGSIKGLGSNSTINASAEGKNAGPGGGGGAGAFCDALFGGGGNGSNGGTGFTGGGAGGQNNSGGPDSYRNGGVGSGSDVLNDWTFEGSQWNAGGISLNGLAAGRTLRDGTYESSGGGTGHPFGLSAPGYNNNGDIGQRNGQFGGGTGNFANGRGGDGGFATDGAGDPSFYSGANGGKAHGNIYGVPIAGGSGGGSGNPNTVGSCGGDGGGGGGAIRVFATTIKDIRVIANGSDGGNGSPDGGAGSGGYVELSAKVEVENVQYSASGGQFGGNGRYRFDALSGFATLITGEPSASVARGMATDTTVFVAPNHTVKVNNRPTREHTYYVKPKGGDWTLVSTSANEIFDINLDLSSGAEEYYGASFQKVVNPNLGTGYLRDPTYILSQAAANRFKLTTPEIECEDDIVINKIECSEDIITAQVEIQNIGFADLEVSLSPVTWSPNDAVASIVNLQASFQISANSSSFLEVEFNLPEGSPNPAIYTLLLETNDADENPKEITFTINTIENPIEIQTTDGVEVEEIEVDVCLKEDELYFEVFQIQNTSGIELNNVRLQNDGNNIIASLGNNQYPIPLTVRLPKSGTTAGTYNAVIYVDSDDCPDPLDSLKVTINVIDTKLELISQPGDRFDFGLVKVGDNATEDIIFENTGNSSLLITDDNLNINAPFALLNSQPAFPAILAPGEQLILTVQFSPTSTGEVRIDPILEFDQSAFFVCEEQFDFEILGDGTQTDLSFPVQVDWGSHEYCYFPHQETIIISNDGNTAFNITGTPFITAGNAGLFRFDGTNRVDNSIPANGTLEVYVSIDLDENGLAFIAGDKSTVIRFETDDPFLPNFEIDLIAEFIEPEVLTEPATRQILLGDVLYGLPVNFDIGLLNNSNTIGMNYLRTEPNDFNIIETGTPIASGESTTLTWDFTPDEGTINESMTFWMVSDLDNCEYPFEVNVFGNGVRQDLVIEPESVDFGENIKCIENLTEEIQISLEGIGEIIISSISLVNNNSNGAISILSDPPNISISSNTYNVTVFYDNALADFGDYNAEIQINYTRNGENEIAIVPISASKVKPATIEPIILDFGDIPINEIAELSSTITRIFFDEEYTYSDFFELNDNQFQTFPEDGDVKNKPYPVSIEFVNRFEAKELGEHSSTVFMPFEYDNYSDCYDTLVYEIKANVVSNMDLVIFTEDLIVDPTLDNIDIPIYARISQPAEYNFNITELKFEIDRSVFYPNAVQGGTINGYEYELDRLILSLSKDDIFLSEDESLLMVLSGVPLLGDKKESIIRATEISIDPSSLLSSATFEQHTYTLTICEEGGDRLIRATNPIELSLNTFSSNVIIKTDIIEAGEHTLTVTDVNGRNYLIEKWIREIGGGNSYRFTLSKSELPMGVYFVRLQTPNRHIVKPLQIVR